MNDVVIGIDLGTTNSAVAVVTDESEGPRLIAVDEGVLLPSVVGFSPGGELLVGAAARNQLVSHPERTVRSIKRRVGEDERIDLGQEVLTPVEISALILRRLRDAAESDLGHPVTRAVITVPAYFSDAQRTATREAGEIAGVIVERIVNEPTAAALCYAEGDADATHFLVYDFGGGTFDVSIVRVREEITEVLASHGDTHLGGDDLDAALSSRLHRVFEDDAGTALPTDDLRVAARVAAAAESAKIRLSSEVHTRVAEEHLLDHEGVPLHLDTVVDRSDYEELIQPFVLRTTESVQQALTDAGVLAREIDEVILVGGTSHTPLVQGTLADLLGRAPRADVDPERAVALGAAVLGGRIAGRSVGRILVDVTPYSFGTRAVGMVDGWTRHDLFAPIIRRNTPLPARRTESFQTYGDYQEAVDVHVYQGESPRASENLLVGRFMVEGLDDEAFAGSEITFEMRLDLNGILDARVTERHTGLEKSVRIEDAFRQLDADELRAAQDRMDSLDGGSKARAGGGGRDPFAAPEGASVEDALLWESAAAACRDAVRLMPGLDRSDRDEVQTLTESLREAMEDHDFGALADLTGELADVLFYLDG